MHLDIFVVTISVHPVTRYGLTNIKDPCESEGESNRNFERWHYTDKVITLCLPACLSVCRSVCLSVCQSVCVPVCLPVCLSVSVCLSVCLSLLTDAFVNSFSCNNTEKYLTISKKIYNLCQSHNFVCVCLVIPSGSFLQASLEKNSL